ncbi:hypothetical protein BOX15_Mlig004100g1 [Macrostomum lignano]|uniref:Uncharacterized protein n=2 Tax=Macrostomum lignano TaxID=282301 RepID=A0A267GWL8_9PLAT|nr:hypothetical protein BOX15_Mlig010662g2 [Macrostomum lignano]PAA89727.1 hypothetical protein BOX15_Mlig004100g1 [Macrostomum lignano]
MSLKVYYDLMSQPARAVLLFLKKNSIEHTPVLIDLRRRAHLTDEFRQVNHFQRVPAIEDSGFCLSESAAILRYLCRRFPCPDHWYPKDLQARARIDQYLDWQHLNTRLNAALLFQTLVIRPRATGQPVDQQRADFYRQELAGTLDHLENFFLRDTPYLAADRISIADLLAACELEQPTACGFSYSAESHPRLLAWMGRVKADLAPHFEEAHRILYMVRDRYNSRQLDTGSGGGPAPRI